MRNSGGEPRKLFTVVSVAPVYNRCSHCNVAARRASRGASTAGFRRERSALYFYSSSTPTEGRRKQWSVDRCSRVRLARINSDVSPFVAGQSMMPGKSQPPRERTMPAEGDFWRSTKCRPVCLVFDAAGRSRRKANGPSSQGARSEDRAGRVSKLPLLWTAGPGHGSCGGGAG